MLLGSTASFVVCYNIYDYKEVRNIANQRVVRRDNFLNLMDTRNFVVLWIMRICIFLDVYHCVG